MINSDGPVDKFVRSTLDSVFFSLFNVDGMDDSFVSNQGCFRVDLSLLLNFIKN